MTTASSNRQHWIEHFVAAAAKPDDPVDVEYATILGAQLFEQLQQMAPRDVAAALLAKRTLPVRGLVVDPKKPSTTFGDL